MTKAKPQLQPLKVGDRVRVYDAGSFNCPMLGIVEAVYERTLDVQTSTAGRWNGYHEQVRRLKKKPRPPKEERVERFVCRTDGQAGTISFCTESALERAYPGTVKEEVVRLVELREGEAIVSREALEKAWTSGHGPMSEKAARDEFEFFCEALGLPGK